MTTSAPITERRYVAPLILVTTLFFLWALGVNLNDVLIPHLKKVFDLNDFQSALIQVAFFGGYFRIAGRTAAGKDRLQEWNRCWFGYMCGGRAAVYSRGLNSGVWIISFCFICYGVRPGSSKSLLTLM
jgi:hypothetical protein